MYTVIAVAVWTVLVVIGTLVAEYFIVRNHEAYLLRKYAEAIVKAKGLKINIAQVENAINTAISSLK